MLGFGFVPTYKQGERGKYQLVVAQSGWQVLKRKLKAITKKTLPYSLDERLRKLEEVWRGWVNNYRMASIHAKLKKMDEWLRNRPRGVHSGTVYGMIGKSRKGNAKTLSGWECP